MDVAPRETNVGLESKFVSVIFIPHHSIEMLVTNDIFLVQTGVIVTVIRIVDLV